MAPRYSRGMMASDAAFWIAERGEGLPMRRSSSAHQVWIARIGRACRLTCVAADKRAADCGGCTAEFYLIRLQLNFRR